MKIHPQALVDPGAVVGARTRVWAFAHVCDGAVIGDDCNLCDHTFFEKGVRLGNRVTIKCGVYLWEELCWRTTCLWGHAWLSPMTCGPAVKSILIKFSKTLLTAGLRRGCQCHPFARHHRTLGDGRGRSGSYTGCAGHALVRGNPARLTGWVCRCGEKLDFHDGAKTACACGRRFEKTSETSINEIP